MRRRLEQARFAAGMLAVIGVAWVALGGFQALWGLAPWFCVGVLMLVPAGLSAWLVLHLVCRRLYGSGEA